MVFTNSNQTLTSKTINATNNHNDNNSLIFDNSSNTGQLVSFKTLEYPNPETNSQSDDPIYWGPLYNNTLGRNEYLAISGINGVEIRYNSNAYSSENNYNHELNVVIPENFVLNSGTQTLTLNADYSTNAAETLHVNGTSAFTGKMTIKGGDGLVLTTGKLDQQLTEDTTNAGIEGSIHTDGGLSVAKHIYVGSGVYLKDEMSISSTDSSLVLHNVSDNTVLSNTSGSTIIKSTSIKLEDNSTSANYINLNSGGYLESNINIVPVTNDSVSLGTTDKRWDKLYLAQELSIGENGTENIVLSGLVLTNHGGSGNEGSFEIKNNSYTTIAQFGQSSSSLYYNGYEKLATSYSGIDITGTLNVSDSVVLASGLTVNGNITGDLIGEITGNADTASKWSDLRTVTFGGNSSDVIGSFSIQGNTDVSDVVLTVVNNSHSHTIANVTGLQNSLNNFIEKDEGTLENNTITGILGVTSNTATSALSNVFSVGTTKSSLVLGGTSYVIHEGSTNTNGTNNSDVLHLCPTDDSTNGDDQYVSIHNKGADETTKLYSNGDITTPGEISAGSISMEGAPFPFTVYYKHNKGAAFDTNGYWTKSIYFPKAGTYKASLQVTSRGNSTSHTQSCHINLKIDSINTTHWF
ncbi:hypothetical protein H8D85_02130 [bacterium]|nr:hypothetical protein [bacterium]